jgi:hypothetical protein
MTNAKKLSLPSEPWGYRSWRSRNAAAHPNTHTFGPFDRTLIRVVVIDPYNQEMRQAIMARGAFAVGVGNGGCTEFCENLTRFSATLSDITRRRTENDSSIVPVRRQII